MRRKTGKLFDSNFKFIIAEASSQAVMHLINRLFRKKYPPDTIVEVREPKELTTENPKSGDLGEIFTDMVITLSSEDKKDTYLIEAQIKDDSEIMLRIFNYSVQLAMKGKTVSEDGNRMVIEMPSPAVVYLETSKTKDFLTIEVRFPGKKRVVYKVPAFKILEHKASELEDMALLLPFYLLKIREELKKSEKDPVKRKELANRLKCYVSEISEVLQKSKKNCYITGKDAAMLQERMSSMHSKLYGRYKEFRESNMTLKQMYNKSVLKKLDDAEARGEAKAVKAEKRGLAQGLTQAAKAMKAAGETVSKIMEYTGLSRREIAAL
ncbi:MAG: hypothetical protein FWC26_01035 [Fibromonadales bacterium]|nr:hypothetical protein [Fibromonadales bacterium]